MFRRLKTRIKWAIRKRYQVNAYLLEDWAMDIIDQYDFDPRTVIQFANRCRISKDFIRYDKEGQVMKGRIYGSTGVYEDNTKEVFVTYFLGEFMAFYRSMFKEEWNANVGGRILYEFFERKLIKEFMKNKMRLTICHEYRHSVQQWFLLDHKINLVDFLNRENAEKVYGKGILEEDAIRYSEQGIDIPMEVLFKDYL